MIKSLFTSFLLFSLLQFSFATPWLYEKYDRRCVSDSIVGSDSLVLFVSTSVEGLALKAYSSTNEEISLSIHPDDNTTFFYKPNYSSYPERDTLYFTEIENGIESDSVELILEFSLRPSVAIKEITEGRSAICFENELPEDSISLTAVVDSGVSVEWYYGEVNFGGWYSRDDIIFGESRFPMKRFESEGVSLITYNAHCSNGLFVNNDMLDVTPSVSLPEDKPFCRSSSGRYTVKAETDCDDCTYNWYYTADEGTPFCELFSSDEEFEEYMGLTISCEQCQDLGLCPAYDDEYDELEIGWIDNRRMVFKNKRVGVDTLSVIVTTEKGCSATDSIILTVEPPVYDEPCMYGRYTSILDQSPSIEIFPNPTQGLIQLESENSNFNIQVFNQTGREVLSTTDGSVDITNEPAGIYYLQIKQSGIESKIIQVVKE